MNPGIVTTRDIRTQSDLDWIAGVTRTLAYAVVGNQEELICEKFPVSLGNEDDRMAFAEIKRKFANSKKHRTMRKAVDEVKLAKPKYTESGFPVYPTKICIN